MHAGNLWSSHSLPKSRGLQRVDAAKSRIESLNPLVTVETMTSPTALERDGFDALVQGVDLVCITDSERDFLVSDWEKKTKRPSTCGEGIKNKKFTQRSCTQIRANEACRRAKKPMYAGGTYGLLGYIFCDLLEHEHITSCVFFILM
jgi:ubiquitin-like 1-activating enzyme E1 A